MVSLQLILPEGETRSGYLGWGGGEGTGQISWRKSVMSKAWHFPITLLQHFSPYQLGRGETGKSDSLGCSTVPKEMPIPSPSCTQPHCSGIQWFAEMPVSAQILCRSCVPSCPLAQVPGLCAFLSPCLGALPAACWRKAQPQPGKGTHCLWAAEGRAVQSQKHRGYLGALLTTQRPQGAPEPFPWGLSPPGRLRHRALLWWNPVFPSMPVQEQGHWLQAGACCAMFRFPFLAPLRKSHRVSHPKAETPPSRQWDCLGKPKL